MGSKTGGNTEPMPFVRKWGADKTDENGANGNGDHDPLANEVAGPAPPPPPVATDEPSSGKKRRDRSRSRSKDRKRKRSRSRDRKKRSRSREKKRESKRSRSRSRDRKRSRSRDRKRDRRDRSRSRDIKRERDPTPEPATPVGPREPVINPLLRPEIVAELTGQVKQEMDESQMQLVAVGQKKRERKSRWSEHKSFIPGMPTILPQDLPDEQRAAYLIQMEVEDATRKLRLGAFDVPGDLNRSPSPEPVYDANGKRLNTRDVRKRQELEQFRHEKIQQLLKLNPNFKPPTDYRPPNVKLHDKVWIPQEAHPEINFVGLLIGPRGNTLKNLELDTGAKIIIRGKGSIKEGKLANRMGPMPGENEPLHAYVTAGDQLTIKKACDKIRQIIAEATCIPDGQNALRQLQLRELALLNGTFRPEDMIGGARCSNCGSDEHKSWECPEAPNVTASIICTSCGCAGHISKDCKNPRPDGAPMPDAFAMDSEYAALMEELGDKPRNAPVAEPVPAPKPQPQQQPFQLPGTGKGNYQNRYQTQSHYQNAFDPQRLQAQAQAWAAQQAAQQNTGNYQDPAANFYASPGAQRGKNQAYQSGSWYGSSAPVPVPPPSSAGGFVPPPPPPPPSLQPSASSLSSILSAAPPPPPPPQ